MKIILLYFLTTMFITFTILYILSPKPQIIIKYPNHNKKLSRLYIDDNNVCYRYKTHTIDCNNI